MYHSHIGEFFLLGNTKVLKGDVASWQQLMLKVEKFYLHSIYNLSVNLKLFQNFFFKKQNA